MKTPIKSAKTTAVSAALATLLTIGVPSVSAAATLVYVSDADDATIRRCQGHAEADRLSAFSAARAWHEMGPTTGASRCHAGSACPGAEARREAADLGRRSTPRAERKIPLCDGA